MAIKSCGRSIRFLQGSEKVARLAVCYNDSTKTGVKQWQSRIMFLVVPLDLFITWLRTERLPPIVPAAPVVPAVSVVPAGPLPLHAVFTPPGVGSSLQDIARQAAHYE
jgi:hypothetical protein